MAIQMSFVFVFTTTVIWTVERAIHVVEFRSILHETRTREFVEVDEVRAKGGCNIDTSLKYRTIASNMQHDSIIRHTRVRVRVCIHVKHDTLKYF